MGLLARLFGREPEPREPATVRWQDHPYTKDLLWRFGWMIRKAKELKLKRERVGRSADYWQGQIDALTGLFNLTKYGGFSYEGQYVRCVRGRCIVCGADEESPCDEEKHRMVSSSSG